MKKISILFAAAAAAFGFVGCSKTEVATAPATPAAGQQFSIVAEISKTSNDGMATNWVALDSINVFHDVTCMEEYSSNDKFTISSEGLSTNKFTGTLAEPLQAGTEYDWYAFYPYTSKLTTPQNTSSTCKTYFNIGCKNSSSTAQVQTGNNSTAHLAGQYFPLWAQTTCEAGEAVTLNFVPALSVVKFHVTNSSTKPLTVNNLSLSSQTQDIIGSYYIDFSGEAPVFEPSDTKYVGNTAKLSVSKATAIAVGESADFYLAIKPFKNAANDVLTFNVNGYEKTTDAEIEFVGGKIKTVNFTYDKEPKEFKEGAYVALIQNSGTSYFAMTSTDDGKSTKRFKSADVTYDGAKTFKTSDASIVWNITKSDNSYLFENGGKYISWSSGNSAIMDTNPYKLDLIENEDYYKIKSNATVERTLSKNSSSAFFAFYGNEFQKVDFLLVPAELSTNPVISPITAPAKVAADGATGVEVSCTVTNPVAGKSLSAVSAESWVNNFNFDTEGKIIFNVDANSAADDRSSEITVSYEGAEDVKFTVTQAGTASTTIYTLQFTKNNNTGYAQMFDVTINGIEWKAPGNQGLDADATYGGKIKIGGKLSEATDRYLYSKNPVGGALKSITFRHGDQDSQITVNSLTISSYASAADAEAGTNAKDTKTVTYANNGETSITVSGENWTGKYIRINYNLSSSASKSNNGIILYYVKFEY